MFGGLFGGNQAQQQQQQQAPSLPQSERTRTPGTAAAPEFPLYTVVKRGERYDLRLYDAFPVVECDYTRREEAYLALGEYQGGANAASVRFGFTQPLVLCYHASGRKVMQAFVGSPRDGSGSSGGALPAPSDARLRLAAGGGELVAVLSFPGFITPEAAASVRRQLADALAAGEYAGCLLHQGLRPHMMPPLPPAPDETGMHTLCRHTHC